MILNKKQKRLIANYICMSTNLEDTFQGIATSEELEILQNKLRAWL